MSGSSPSSRLPGNWQPGRDYWIYMPSSISEFLPATARTSLNPRVRTRDPWLLVEERFIGVPNRGLASFPPTPPPRSRPSVPLLLFDQAYPTARPDSPPPYYQPWTDPRSIEEQSRLSPEEQKQAVSKLRKQFYSPHINNIIRRLGTKSSSSSSSSSKGEEDVGKRCAICLEDFETKQFVTATPCDHIFHEECIVPWVKSQGKCPVCRFVIAEKSQPQWSRNDVAFRRGGVGRNTMF